jgi:hypothetical protein
MITKMRVQIIFIILLSMAMFSPVMAQTNVSAYGGVMELSSNTSGNDTLQIRTNIPLTVEDIAYPDWLFAIIAVIGLIFLVASIWFISRPDDVPIIAMLMSGFITAGCYTACAMMAPYVASIQVTRDIVVGTDGSNTIYVTQSVTYLLSPWVGWACWGMALAGGIVVIAAALSWAGYLDMKGLKAASEGRYLETDMPEGGQDQSSLSYKRMGNGKAKR